MCSDLKFAALNVFKTIFFQRSERNEKMFENRKTETQCVRSAGAKISEVFYFDIYCLLGIGLHVLVSNGPITCYLLHIYELPTV